MPTTTGGVPQGLFGPAVTTPTTATTAGSRAARAAGCSTAPNAAAARRQGREGVGAFGAGEEARRTTEGEEEPQNLARRETGNVWGYIKPNEDPYN